MNDINSMRCSPGGTSPAYQRASRSGGHSRSPNDPVPPSDGALRGFSSNTKASGAEATGTSLTTSYGLPKGVDRGRDDDQVAGLLDVDALDGFPIETQ